MVKTLQLQPSTSPSFWTLRNFTILGFLLLQAFILWGNKLNLKKSDIIAALGSKNVRVSASEKARVVENTANLRTTTSTPFNPLATTRHYPTNTLAHRHQTPNWMIAVDCASFDQSCGSYHRERYAPYPFDFLYQPPNGESSSSSIQEITTENYPEWLTKQDDNPSSFVPFPLKHARNETIDLNLYPPEVSETLHTQCYEKGLTTSYEEQLEAALGSLDKMAHLEDSIVFTIADYKYAHDMVHSFFQMTWELVAQGNQKSALMVALDAETLDLACRYGYPVVHVGKTNDNNAKDVDPTKFAVQNTKFLFSRDVVAKNFNFIFYEMDVWWIQSPVPILQKTMHQTLDQGRIPDIIISDHQDNPNAPNIGFYVVQSNERTIEFFTEFYAILEQVPNVFDQFAFIEVADNNAHARPKSGTFLHERWGDLKPAIPNWKHRLNVPLVKLEGGYMSAQEWPIVSDKTVAIHTLCGAPLSNPNGKKMVAKELGAWYGFQSNNEEDDATLGGYYKRTTPQYRRYLMLDGKNFMGHDFNENIFYHDSNMLKWTIALLVLVARQTDRILILPKILHDRGTTFLWTGLDLQSLEGLVEFRETNFLNQPQAWWKDNQPFESVARTALGRIPKSADGKLILYGQAKDAPSLDAYDTWRFEDRHSNFLDEHYHWMELWMRLLTSRGYDDAELLLVNPQVLFRGHSKHYMLPKEKTKRYDMAEWPLLQEFHEIAIRKLRWCGHRRDDDLWDKFMQVWPSGRARAQDDCYGKGVPIENFKPKE